MFFFPLGDAERSYRYDRMNRIHWCIISDIANIFGNKKLLSGFIVLSFFREGKQ